MMISTVSSYDCINSIPDREDAIKEVAETRKTHAIHETRTGALPASSSPPLFPVLRALTSPSAIRTQTRINLVLYPQSTSIDLYSQSHIDRESARKTRLRTRPRIRAKQCDENVKREDEEKFAPSLSCGGSGWAIGGGGGCGDGGEGEGGGRLAVREPTPAGRSGDRDRPHPVHTTQSD